MHQRMLGHALMGVVSVVCVCVGEIPYSLVPFAVFLYVTLPTRCARRPLCVKRLAPVGHTARAVFLEEGSALLREAQDAVQSAERNERVRVQAPSGGRARSTLFEETFEETFD